MIIFLCDLDDTLFSTKGKIKHQDELTLMSTLKDGAESGYATERQRRLIDLMSRENDDHQFIAVTARDEDAFSRVNIHCATAVLANGGIILRKGEKDQSWMKRNADMAKRHDNISLIKPLAEKLDERWRHWAINDGATDLYYVIKHQQKDLEEVVSLAKFLSNNLPASLHVQQNGNNIAITPLWLSKKTAVEHIVSEIRLEHPSALTIGMGDSIADLPFMLTCDYGVFPGSSQVADAIKQNIVK